MNEAAKAWPAIKHWLKIGRWKMRRAVTAVRWGPEILAKTPAILGNAMPKSGSHLIIQVLHGLTRLGPFVNSGFPPVNRSEDNRKLSEEAVLKNIRYLKPGDIGYGYIQCQQPFIEAVIQPGIAMVFVYRDPRDMIISHIFYATEMHQEHGMHQYYTKALGSMEERINAAIKGVEEEGSELSSVRTKYLNYLGWLEHKDVLSLRFEDLILQREESLGRLLDYLFKRGFSYQVTRDQAIETLNAAVVPSKSGTFRRGKPGNWQDYFTPANKALFKEVTGDLLIRLSYERDNEW